IGSAADESLPDEAPSATQVAKALQEGKWPGKAKEPQNSQAIIEGLGRCFYPMIEALDAPPASAHCEQWVEGANLAFGLIESPAGYERTSGASPHEMFIYVIRGALDAEVDGEKKRAVPGDVIHMPKNGAWRWRVAGDANARYAMVRSTPKLEAEIDRNGAADNWRG
ncbi:MAG: cupin domain-containing protein, partial [Burkholderiales bacterium]|nr:cupin domain-containing protein [Burkholderiales bacterium]